MRLIAVAGISCLTIRSLIVLLTICWFCESEVLIDLLKHDQSGYEPLYLESGSFLISDNFDATNLLLRF